MAATNSTQRITCPKCNGAKALDWCMGVANGTCFECAGTGRITVAALSKSKTAKLLANKALYTADDLIDGLDYHDIDSDRVAHYSASIVASLHKVGTENARMVLNRVGARCPALRAKLIEMGRAA